MKSDKIILSVATTGSWAAKAQNPALPVRKWKHGWFKK